MENDFNFDFDKKLNIKKVIFVGIVALFLLVILIELISTPFKKKKEQLLIKEAKELGLKTLHSLRMDGPLEIEM